MNNQYQKERACQKQSTMPNQVIGQSAQFEAKDSVSLKVLNQLREVELKLNSLAGVYHNKLAPIAYSAEPCGEALQSIESYPEYFEQLRVSIASINRTIDGLFNLLDRVAL